MTTDTLEALREAREHNLKTWPEAYDAVYADLKPWEFRKNDRDYRVGDTLRLLRWSPDSETYTGEEMRRRVVWILEGGRFGVPEGYCIMTLSRIDAAVASDHIGNSTTMVPALGVARIKATIWKHWRKQNGQTLEDRFTSAAEEIAAMEKNDE
jgi:hypothetical protein